GGRSGADVPRGWAGRRRPCDPVTVADNGGVTALPREGGSFSSCRSSLTRAQPGPACDIDRTIHVGVHWAARGADHGVLAGAGASRPAVVAGDACPGRVHQHDSAGSFLRFPDENASELVPGRVQDALVQPALAAAWFGRYAPGFCVSGLGAGRLVIPAMFR